MGRLSSPFTGNPCKAFPSDGGGVAWFGQLASCRIPTAEERVQVHRRVQSKRLGLNGDVKETRDYEVPETTFRRPGALAVANQLALF